MLTPKFSQTKFSIALNKTHTTFFPHRRNNYFSTLYIDVLNIYIYIYIYRQGTFACRKSVPDFPANPKLLITFRGILSKTGGQLVTTIDPFDRITNQEEVQFEIFLSGFNQLNERTSWREGREGRKKKGNPEKRESDIFHPVYRIQGWNGYFFHDVIVCTGQRRHNNNRWVRERKEEDGIKESLVQENISIPFQREGKEVRAEREDRGK